MEKKNSLTNELKVIVTNPLSEEQAKERIREISKILSKKGCIRWQIKKIKKLKKMKKY